MTSGNKRRTRGMRWTRMRGGRSRATFSGRPGCSWPPTRWVTESTGTWWWSARMPRIHTLAGELVLGGADRLAAAVLRGGDPGPRVDAAAPRADRADDRLLRVEPLVGQGPAVGLEGVVLEGPGALVVAT